MTLAEILELVGPLDDSPGENTDDEEHRGEGQHGIVAFFRACFQTTTCHQGHSPGDCPVPQVDPPVKNKVVKP